MFFIRTGFLEIHICIIIITIIIFNKAHMRFYICKDTAAAEVEVNSADVIFNMRRFSRF